MVITRTREELYKILEEFSKNPGKLALIPTMGNLHDGHLSLIKLAKQKIGNLLVIKNTGAYGKVMSSNYNSRPLPSEILVHSDNYAIIYSPEKIEKTIEADIIPSWL